MRTLIRGTWPYSENSHIIDHIDFIVVVSFSGFIRVLRLAALVLYALCRLLRGLL